MASPPEIARKNGMLGGRPKGSLNKLTLLKEKRRNQIDKSIATMALKITNSQAMTALGTHKLLELYKDESTGLMQKRVVNDIKRIEKFLESGVYGVDYIIVVGKNPDWKAGNALLDRTFGKAKETVEHTGEVTFSLKALAESRRNIDDEPLDIESEVLP